MFVFFDLLQFGLADFYFSSLLVLIILFYIKLLLLIVFAWIYQENLDIWYWSLLYGQNRCNCFIRFPKSSGNQQSKVFLSCRFFMMAVFLVVILLYRLSGFIYHQLWFFQLRHSSVRWRVHLKIKNRLWIIFWSNYCF